MEIFGSFFELNKLKKTLYLDSPFSSYHLLIQSACISLEACASLACTGCTPFLVLSSWLFLPIAENFVHTITVGFSLHN